MLMVLLLAGISCRWRSYRFRARVIPPAQWFCARNLLRRYNSTNAEYDCRSDHMRTTLFFSTWRRDQTRYQTSATRCTIGPPIQLPEEASASHTAWSSECGKGGKICQVWGRRSRKIWGKRSGMGVTAHKHQSDKYVLYGGSGMPRCNRVSRTIKRSCEGRCQFHDWQDQSQTTPVEDIKKDLEIVV